MIFPLTSDPAGPILAVQPGRRGQFIGRKAGRLRAVISEKAQQQYTSSQFHPVRRTSLGWTAVHASHAHADREFHLDLALRCAI